MSTDNRTNRQSYEDTILRREFQRWEACGNPPAWAQIRDAASKSLPWFHMVQGGVDLTSNNKKDARHTSPVYITGILIDGYSAPNSYIDSEVIITSLHGVQEDLKKTGATAKRRIEALKATLDDRRLIGCLIGNDATNPAPGGKSSRGDKRKWTHADSAFFPCPMPKNQDCWVLGFYIITDHWEQMTKNGWVTMVRLERWKLQEKAWFASKDESHTPPPLVRRDFNTKALEKRCRTCKEASPRMFDDFFLCGHKDCSDFWKHGGETVTADLTYTKVFLQQRTPRTNPPELYALYEGKSKFPEIAPSFETWWEQKYNQLITEPITKENFQERMKSLSHGFQCPNCGMLNRRLKWQEWNCAKKDCDFSRPGQPNVISAAEIIEFGSTTGPDWSKLPCFEREDDNSPRYTKYHFDLKNECKITVMIPKGRTNAMKHGANWLWNQFQRQANDGTLGLEKRFIQSASEGTVTSHFSANFGEEYKQVVRTSETKKFKDAPSVISTARNAVNTECSQYQQSQGTEDFNQCYVAGYFTDNVMHWHNDGEIGLGSVIATWTLGGEGRMSFCPKLDQYWGQTRSKDPIEEDLVLSGVRREAERRVLKERLDRERRGHGDPNHICGSVCKAALAAYTKAFKALIKTEVRPYTAAPQKWLTFPLVHGSIVVMHGRNMQKHYVHEVSVKTPLRFALTFRHISEEHKGAKDSKRLFPDYPHVPDTTPLEEFRKAMSENEAKKQKR